MDSFCYLHTSNDVIFILLIMKRFRAIGIAMLIVGNQISLFLHRQRIVAGLLTLLTLMEGIDFSVMMKNAYMNDSALTAFLMLKVSLSQLNIVLVLRIGLALRSWSHGEMKSKLATGLTPKAVAATKFMQLLSLKTNTNGDTHVQIPSSEVRKISAANRYHTFNL